MNKLIAILVAAILFLFIGKFLWNSSENGLMTETKTSENGKIHDISLTTPWIEYDDPAGAFSVKFPTKPQLASQKGLDKKSNLKLKYDMVVSESLQGNVFMVNTITYPEGGIKESDKEEITKRVMKDMMANNKDNQLKEAKNGVYQGHKSYNFELDTPNKNVKTTTFIDGRTLYVLSAVTKKDVDVENEFKFFINNFKLNNTNKGKE